MTVKKYAGDKITGISSDTKPTNVPEGATFYELDTGKVFRRYSSAWTEIENTKANNAYNLANTANVTAIAAFNKANSVSAVQGTTGFQGIQGIQGTIGTQGLQGIQGANGFQGIQGTTGTQGANGFQGLQGTTGTQGANGFQGLQGTTGTQGANGTQGLQGLQGSAGPSTIINATAVTVNDTVFPVFVTDSGSNQTAQTSVGLTFNPSTNTLTVGTTDVVSGINSKLSSSGGTITGNLAITGSLSVAGNSYIVDTQTLRVSDPLIYLAGNNYTSDIVDIGFVGNYVNATGSNVHTGLFRDATTKEYYIFEGYDQEPNPNHIDISGNNFTISTLNATIKSNNIALNGTNVATWISNAYNRANVAANGVVTFSAGTTGFTPSVATNGAVTLGGTLAVANGGTGQTVGPVAFDTLRGYLAVTASATPVTLTSSSARTIYVTGSLTQPVTLPDTSTLQLGTTYTIINGSSGTTTVSTSTAVALSNIPTGIVQAYTCISTSVNTAAGWQLTVLGATSRAGQGSLVFTDTPTFYGELFSTSGTTTAGTNAQGQGSITSTSDFVIITSTPNNPSGVTLASASSGRRVLIFNRGTNPINVYPAVNQSINQLGANSAFNIPVNAMQEFHGVTSTAWMSGSTSAGIQGIQGIQGANGFQGIQGTTGTQGANGFQGLQGTTGAQGANGFQGTTGTQGANGIQGTTGTQGANGFQGLQGTLGTQGANGFQGLQGTTGTQGANGFQGLQGTTGTQGANGFQGLQGTLGTQGANGFQGLQGIQGTSIQGANGSVSGGSSITLATDIVNATRYLVFANNITGTLSTANVSTGITFNPSSNAVTISGSLNAVTKSFVIDHPTKNGMTLRYGSLEGPENGVYVRGRVHGPYIYLPDYWLKLVDENSITVSLTPIAKTEMPSVLSWNNEKVVLHSDSSIDCFYHIFGERKDVKKLIVEY